MSREDAEKDASTIDEARREQTDIELPWLKMHGGMIVARALESEVVIMERGQAKRRPS